MARLEKKGVALQLFNEYEGTLADIVEGLGLKPLHKEAEQRIRKALGFAMGRWRDPEGAIEAQRIARSLASMANQLEAIDRALAATEFGLQSTYDIEIASRLAQALGECPTVGSDKALSVLSDFRETARLIALAARISAKYAGSTRGESGRTRLDWYDGFTHMVVAVCKQNEIRITLVNDRSSGLPGGRFLEVAEGFERLLLPQMRSPSRQALAKRLRRSLKRLEQRPAAGANHRSPLP